VPFETQLVQVFCTIPRNNFVMDIVGTVNFCQQQFTTWLSVGEQPHSLERGWSLCVGGKSRLFRSAI
jgi:hypothetical protein